MRIESFQRLCGLNMAERDGESLSKAIIEVLEDYGIAERLLGVTADNASNNSKMMQFMEAYYTVKYQEAGFSVNWNQVECMAHVINLGAQQLLKQFKQPVDKYLRSRLGFK